MLNGRVCLLVGLWVVASGSAAYAQVASRVAGTVRDSSDAVMASVNVTLEEVDKGTTVSTVTNDAGRYVFPTLTVGRYRVSAEAQGFKKSVTEPFVLNVNQTVEMNFHRQFTPPDRTGQLDWLIQRPQARPDV